MRKTSTTLCIFLILFSNPVYSQVTFASENFENALTLFTKTGPGTFYSGVSGGFTSPFGSPYAQQGTYAYGVAGGTDTLTSSAINTSAHTSVQLTMRLASFATNLSGGNDMGDYVRIEISPDDGAHYYPTVQVTGNINAWWSYSGGTGIASATYDGDPTIVTFSPAGGGNRTTDGYSTITISSLPESIKLKVRIILKNDSNSELWLIDRFEIKGNAVVGPLLTIYPLALPNFYSVTGNPSAEQTYQVSGSSLTNDIIINPLPGYEVSITSGSGFGSSITLPQSGGMVSSTAIYVRLNAVTTGSYSGGIANTSVGATAKNVAVVGNVLVPEPTVVSTVSFSNLTTTSMDINFPGGNGEGRIVVVKQSSPVGGVPIDALNYTANTVFGTGNTISTGEYVVYNGTGTSVSITGLTANRTYHIAVFEYNDGGQLTARNYQSIAGTGNTATPPFNEGLEITTVNSVFTIDFDNTVNRVNNGAFAGVNINTAPAVGEINSNAWSFGLYSFGPFPSVFGGSTNSGGGVSTGNVSTGTYYAFEASPGNRSFGFQLTNTNSLRSNALRIQNNTGTTLTTLAISYEVHLLNNTNDATYNTFEYSLDNINYFLLSTDTSDIAADASPAWKASLRSRIIGGLSILNGDHIYLRWGATQYLGSAESDEIAWDDISIVANPTTVFPRISGSFEDMHIFGPVQLSGNTTVAGGIIFYSAYNIELGNYDLTIGGPILNNSGGYLQTNGTGSVTLTNVTSTARLVPLGITTYNPLIISNGSGLNWTFRLDNGITNVLPPNNTDKAVLRTWTITPSTNPPPAGANITFQYNDGDPTQVGSNFNSAENVQLWHNDGFGWESASGGLTPTGTPGGIRTVTLTNWTDFSAFAISNISGALPVKFGAIKALKDPAGVRIKWTNYTETNLLYYSVERSADARIFAAIGMVNPNLNNSNAADYSSIDPRPLNGNNFYRIAAIETNGNIVYSRIVRINLDKSLPGILVFPNPAQNSNAYLQLTGMPKGSYEIKIFSSNAQLVLKEILSHDGGSLVTPLNIPASLKPGFYLIQVLNKEVLLYNKFILK